MRIEKWVGCIAQEMSNSLGYDDEKMAVIEYGLFALIHIILSIGVVAVFGGVFNVLIESLIVSFSMAYLRKASGGEHATSAERCLILGTIIAVAGGGIGKCLREINLSIFLMISSLVIVWSTYIISKYAPMESKNKPISKEKKRKLKKRCLQILFTYILILGYITISSILGREKVLGYGICLLIGICYQIITLTPYGSKLIKLADFFLINISNGLRGGK